MSVSFDSQTLINNLPSKPGIYRMLGKKHEILYVGKASNLKKRVSSYFNRGHLPVKTQRLISQVVDIETTITNTEAEALILEHNIIKEFKPRYNVLLRDDKSYPYILLSQHHYPRLVFHRGAKKKTGEYFGPYPSSGSVRQTNQLLQKLFKVRACEDSYFNNRTRPCLQYQIKRCKAPCVGLVSQQEYAIDIQHVKWFLQGKSARIVDTLVEQMDIAAQALHYEKAAQLRDQISALRYISQKQCISGEKGDLDIVAVHSQGGIGVVQVFFIRDGRMLGNKSYFPKTPDNTDEEELLRAFLLQFYLKRETPAEVLINRSLEDAELLEAVFSERNGHKVKLRDNVRGDRAGWLKLAIDNAQQAHQHLITSRQGIIQRLQQLQELFELDRLPERLECFDISHTMGEATVASCVVFNSSGPLKSDYRRFNIQDITAGDDYAAMRQAITRRYKRLKSGESVLPDILFIDGGKGQVTQAIEVLAELDIDNICIIGIAKGPERIAGEETLILPHLNTELNLPSDHPGLHLIQQIRDEAHRFAITGHRTRRSKQRQHSVLEEIPGLGQKRRQQLLKHFGGLQTIQGASVSEIAKVSGISGKMAQLIYDQLH